jgi:hypothetical protein
MRTILSNQVFNTHPTMHDRLVVKHPDIVENTKKPGIKFYNKFIGIILSCFGFAVRLKCQDVNGKMVVYLVNTKSYKNWLATENAYYHFSQPFESIDALIAGVAKQKKGREEERQEATLNEHVRKVVEQTLQEDEQNLKIKGTSDAYQKAKIELEAAKIRFAKQCEEFEKVFPPSWALRTPLKWEYLHKVDACINNLTSKPLVNTLDNRREEQRELIKQLNEFATEMKKYREALLKELHNSGLTLKQFYPGVWTNFTH